MKDVSNLSILPVKGGPLGNQGTVFRFPFIEIKKGIYFFPRLWSASNLVNLIVHIAKS